MLLFPALLKRNAKIKVEPIAIARERATTMYRHSNLEKKERRLIKFNIAVTIWRKHIDCAQKLFFTSKP